MTYRYIEFTDRTAASSRYGKAGALYYVGKPSEELIAELEMERVVISGLTYFKTTLQAIGEKGWELQFVTPCGANLAKRDSIGGPIENSYIFRKVEA